MQTGVAAASEADRSDTRIADEFQTVLVADVVDQLNGGRWQAGLFDGFQGLLSQQPGGVGVERMGFRDDGIAGGDGGGKVSATDAVEG